MSLQWLALRLPHRILANLLGVIAVAMIMVKTSHLRAGVGTMTSQVWVREGGESGVGVRKETAQGRERRRTQSLLNEGLGGGKGIAGDDDQI